MHENQAKSGICGNLFVMFSNKYPKMIFWIFLFQPILGGQPSDYTKLINIHDVGVSISAWVSHVMPLNPYGPLGFRSFKNLLSEEYHGMDSSSILY